MLIAAVLLGILDNLSSAEVSIFVSDYSHLVHMMVLLL